MPAGTLHSLPAGRIFMLSHSITTLWPGLRGCTPEDPSEDKPDCAKENLRRRRSSFPASRPWEADEQWRLQVDSQIFSLANNWLCRILLKFTLFPPGLAPRATSLCSPELSAQTPMWKALLKPGPDLMPLTLVEPSLSFNLLEIYFTNDQIWEAVCVSVPARVKNIVNGQKQISHI